VSAGEPIWQDAHRGKIATAAEAVRRIPPRCRILIGSGAAEPNRLVEAMVGTASQLEGNEVVHLMTLGSAPYVQPGLEARFRHTAFFIGANVRAAVQEGRADFMPVFLSEIPQLIASGRVGVDVALIQVSPPDRHGFVSLGVSVDIVRAAVDTAGLVLAEVNPRMPRTLGDSFLHVDQIGCLVPVDDPLPELSCEAPDAVSRRIGENVASLIDDGATLQLGIGRIPDATLEALVGRQGLGIHSEMISDGVMRLAQAGVIDGRRKTLLPGKIVTSFVMGSRELYRWVDDNPQIEMKPSSFTNDPFVIARNARMVAINSALAVDLTGQVAADTVRGRLFSGIGGQVDFIRGAARSAGGRPGAHTPGPLPTRPGGGDLTRRHPLRGHRTWRRRPLGAQRARTRPSADRRRPSRFSRRAQSCGATPPLRLPMARDRPMRWPMVLTTLLVLLLALAAVVAVADWRWQRTTSAAVASLHASATGQVSAPDAADALPAPVRRYLAFAIRRSDRSPIVGARLVQEGEFALKRGAWMPFTGVQHYAVRPPGFVWDARIRMAPLLQIRVRDAYRAGRGETVARLAGILPLADQEGGDELAVASLQRWLAELPWLPTALQPSPALNWQAIDATSARATLKDGALETAVEFHFGGQGEIAEMSALRGREVEGRIVPTPWRGRFWDYRDVNGFRIPHQGEVAWLLPDGPFSYWHARILRCEIQVADGG
jgi:acyl-CoA hydrolase